MTPLRGDGARPVALLCLDTLARADGWPWPEAAAAWSSQAARLLRHARARGWLVVHVLGGRACGRARWRAADGLSPLPYERIFHRDGPSAFSAPGLYELLSDTRETVLVGGAGGAALAASLRDALRLQLAVTVASDAVQAPPRDWGLAGVRPEGRGLVLQNTARLLAAAPPLRLVAGGQVRPALAAAIGGDAIDDG